MSHHVVRRIISGSLGGGGGVFHTYGITSRVHVSMLPFIVPICSSSSEKINYFEHHKQYRASCARLLKKGKGGFEFCPNLEKH